MSNDDITPIEMDEFPTAFRPEVAAPADNITLDMTDAGQVRCVDCGGNGLVNDAGRCLGCAVDALGHQVPVAELARELTSIGEQGAANAAVQALGSMRTGELRGVGFSTKEGYIDAIRHGVKAATHASYLTTLRAQYGLTSADIEALNLPGPMAETTLPVGAGVVHRPDGHKDGSAGIFERKDRAFKVGDAPAQYNVLTPADLTPDKIKNVIAVSDSTGNGVVIAWNGRRTIKRAELTAALAKVGAEDMAPKANSARAQAGRTVQCLSQHGYVVRVERRNAAEVAADRKAGKQVQEYDARWTVGRVNHAATAAEQDSEALGKRVLQITLIGDKLTFVGDADLGRSVLNGYQQRIGEEQYQSGDITAWLGGKLRKHCDAVQFGALGWYVPPKHAARAGELCQAVASTGFGSGWVLPGLPITTSEILRDGILSGLTDEVDALMDQLASERKAAKELRESGDIGHKRAGTFLADLRKIGERVAGYATVLGGERILVAKARIRTGIAELEAVLGDDHQGISARFAAVWDEIERDRERNGGAL